MQKHASGERLHPGKLAILGIQHTFTMFGATVLVPILTGLDISVALFMAGVGTLLFHLITSGKVPVFLGSSFAFITPIISVMNIAGLGKEYAQGGLVVAGVVYLVIAVLVMIFGYQKVLKIFPPIVTGPIIMVIGLTLAGTAVNSASDNWLIAFVTFLIVLIISIFTRGFIQMLPVICGLAGGYLFSMCLGAVDFSPITSAAWIGVPEFTIAKFDLTAISIIAPAAIATIVEHMGDVAAVSATVGKNFMKDPGVHRTLIGDGLATSLSAMFGGPANTTYSENTGVLALTGVYNPWVMRIAACCAIVLGLFPKFGAVISTIPTAVIGGISIVLFGMISSIGIRSLIDAKIDFVKPRNLLITAVILVLGIGGASIPFTIGSVEISIGGLALASIIGIILNLVLPGKDPVAEEK